MDARLPRVLVTTGASLGLLSACGLEVAGLDVTDEGGAGGDGGSDVVVSVDGGTGADGSPGDDAWAGGDTAAHGDAVASVSEGGATTDAPAESATPDGPWALDGACPGVTCNGACLPDPDCHACAGAPLLCASTGACGADCARCPASPVECFACDTNRLNPIGTCQPADPQSYCLDTNYTGAYGGANGEHCGCNVAADCPGDDQVCISFSGTTTFACFTCGEAYTQAFDCKSGGKCNAAQFKCN